jgi:uncharacterized membrane protein YphA (DoxX/SURF4 family)
MFIVTAILSVLLALVFAGTGSGKVRGQQQLMDGLGRLGVSPKLGRMIGALELAGAAGLLVGLLVSWLGIAAAVGLALMMAGATIYHARAGDYGDPQQRSGAFASVVLFAISAATAVVHLLAI